MLSAIKATGPGGRRTARSGSSRILSAERTPAYGRWRVRIQTDDGRQVEAWGLTEQQAEYRARVRAQEQEGEGR